jgi:putative hydrolase of the HAD superfamily
MRPNKRAILFDVDGVLIHGYHARPELQQRWDETLLEDLGIDPERFRNEFIHDNFIKKVIVGKMALIDALERVLPSLGYSGSPMIVAQYWLSHDSRINRPLLDAIRRLKEEGQSRLYIATNQEHMRALWLWQTLGLGELFEDIFYSARIGIRKPERGYFDFIERRIGLQSEPPLFFDDTPEVTAAARKHGWDAVLFDTIDDCTRHPWIAERLQ